MLETLSIVRERGHDNFRLLLVGDGLARHLIQAQWFAGELDVSIFARRIQDF